MRFLGGFAAGAALIVAAIVYGPRLAGRILAVPDDVDGRHR